MPHPAPNPAPDRLADEIARRLSELADRLSMLPSREATQIIARVLDPEDGVLGRFTHLVITGSYFAKTQAEEGSLPAEVWLALGRAANELHDIGLDLDEHTDTLQRLHTRPASPLVVRRHR